jgi:hypothetical protein
VDFAELPDGHACIVVQDEEMSEAIWQSHIHGGRVIVAFDDSGLHAEIETVTPAPEDSRTPEQIKIDYLETQNAAIIFTLVMNDLM